MARGSQIVVEFVGDTRQLAKSSDQAASTLVRDMQDAAADLARLATKSAGQYAKEWQGTGTEVANDVTSGLERGATGMTQVGGRYADRLQAGAAGVGAEIASDVEGDVERGAAGMTQVGGRYADRLQAGAAGAGREIGDDVAADLAAVATRMSAIGGQLAARLESGFDNVGDAAASRIARDLKSQDAKFKAAGKDAGDDFEGGLSDAFDGMSGRVGTRVGPIFASLGGGLGAKLAAGFAAVGVGAIISKGFVDSMDIEAGVDKLQSQLGLTAKHADRIGNLAGETYAGAWGDSLDEVQGMYASTMRAFPRLTDEALQQVTESAATVSDVWDQDFNEVVRAAQQLLINGLAPDAQTAMDQVATALQRTRGPQDEVIEAIKEYANHFAQIGLDGPAVVSTLTSEWATNQHSIDKAGDAVKEFGIRVMDGSATTKEGLEGIGLSIREVETAYNEGGDSAEAMTKRIIRAIINIDDPVERAKVGVALMGTQFEDLGNNAVPILRSIIGGQKDLTDSVELGNIAYDNAKTKIESWRRQGLMKLTEFIGGTVIPTLEEELAPAVKEVSREFGRANRVITGGGGAVPQISAAVQDHLGVRVPDSLSASRASIKGYSQAVKAAADDSITSWSGLGDTLTSDTLSWGEKFGLIWRDIWADTSDREQSTIDQINRSVNNFHEGVLGSFRWFYDEIIGRTVGAGKILTGIFRVIYDGLSGVAQAGFQVLSGDFKGAYRTLQGITTNWGRDIDQIVEGVMQQMHGNTREGHTKVNRESQTKLDANRRAHQDVYSKIRGNVRDEHRNIFGITREGHRKTNRESQEKLEANRRTHRTVYSSIRTNVRDEHRNVFGITREGHRRVNREAQIKLDANRRVWRDIYQRAIPRSVRDGTRETRDRGREGAENTGTAMNRKIAGGVRRWARIVDGFAAGLRGGLNPILSALKADRIRTPRDASVRAIDRAVSGFADGGIAVPFTTRADGGVDVMVRRPQAHITHKPTVLFGEPETQGEAYIPFAPSKRQRSRKIADETVKRLGGQVSWGDGDVPANIRRRFRFFTDESGGTAHIRNIKRDRVAHYTWLRGSQNWWNWDRALAAWRDISGMRIERGVGRNQVLASARSVPGDPRYGWVTNKRLITLNSAQQQNSAVDRLVTAVHEIGHTLGFGHPNTASVMNSEYAHANNVTRPTLWDRGFLQRMFGDRKAGVPKREIIDTFFGPVDLPKVPPGDGTVLGRTARAAMRHTRNKAREWLNEQMFGGMGPGGGGLVAFGRWLQSRGIYVGEHPAFGGVGSGHVSGSYHFRGRAIDISPPHRWIAQAAIGKFGRAIRELITPWRDLDRWNGRRHYYSPDTHANHLRHVHLALANGGILNGRRLASFEHGTPYVPQTGLAMVHRGERITPAGRNAADFDRVIAVMEQQNRHLEEQNRLLRQQNRLIADGHVIDRDSLVQGLAPEMSRALATRRR